jgi:ABC-type glutathione transport system ATPase component
MTCFSHPISYDATDSSNAPLSARAALVARWFGVDERSMKQRARRRAARPNATRLALRCLAPPPSDEQLLALLPAAGQIVLVTGPSGAGKSSLLRALETLARAREQTWLDFRTIDVPQLPTVDCFGTDASLDDVLALLARVGLAEVWTYLRIPAQLSDGQRWRLKLAIALDVAQRRSRPRKSDNSPPSAPGSATPQAADSLLVIDEFAALLDRVTASIVARTLRRAIDAHHSTLGALVATGHDDLARALAPDRIVHCDFGKVSVQIGRQF